MRMTLGYVEICKSVSDEVAAAEIERCLRMHDQDLVAHIRQNPSNYSQSPFVTRHTSRWGILYWIKTTFGHHVVHHVYRPNIDPMPR